MTYLLATIIFVTSISICVGRDVPGLQEICARGNYAFCPTNNAPSAPQRLPAADLPPPTNSPPPPQGPPTSLADYCGRYQPHFMFYCDAAEAKDQKASDFCPDYLSHCVLKSAGPSADVPMSPPDQQPPTTASKVVVPCSTYRPQFTLHCTQVVSDPKIAQFCQNFQTYCLNVPPPAPTLPPVPVDTSLVLGQLADKCFQYKNAYKLYCTGPVTVNSTAQIKQYCDMYKQYCIGTGVATLNRRKRNLRSSIL